MSKIFDFVKPGVVTGDDVQKIFKVAKENKFALPAVNCVGTDSINAVLETAAKVKAPVIIQFSNGGAGFIAGKGIKSDRPRLLQFLVQFLVLITCTRWQSTTVCRSFCILTTVPKNCCRGSMDCWMQVKRTLRKLASHFFFPYD